MSSARKLKITNNGEIDLYEASSNGSSKVAVKAPASLAGDLSVVLPSTAGSSGQFLKTDGAGNTSWDNGTATLQSAYTAGNSITIASNPVSIDRATGGEALEVKATTSGNPYVSIEAGTSVNQVGTTASGAGWVGTTSDNNLEIKSNNVTRVTVKNTGEVSIHNDAAVTGLEIQQDGAAAGMTVLQTTNSNALEVHNDGTGAGILVHQDGAGKALDITQDGDSNALDITKTGTSTAAGISVTNSAVGSPGILVTQNSDNIGIQIQKSGTGAGNVISVHNDGIGDGVYIIQDGAGKGISITQNGGEVALEVNQTRNYSGIYINKTGASSGFGIHVHNDGTNAGIHIHQDGAGYGISIQQDGGNTALYIEQNTSYPVIHFNGPNWYTGTAAPSGSYTRGDIVWNTLPSAAGYVGWVCTTTGDPATFKGFGVIAS